MINDKAVNWDSIRDNMTRLTYESEGETREFWVRNDLVDTPEKKEKQIAAMKDYMDNREECEECDHE